MFKMFSRRRIPRASRSQVESLETRALLSAAAGPVEWIVDLGHRPGRVEHHPERLSAIIESANPNLALSRALGDNLLLIEAPRDVSKRELRNTLDDVPGFHRLNRNRRLSIAATINDPMFESAWGLHNSGQNGATPDIDIDAPEAWEITRGSPSTIVAVLDTGIDYAHPDLASSMWTNPAEVPGNNRDDDSNGFIDDVHGYDFANRDASPADDNRHGTHVAGIIAAAADNNIGVSGVAPGVKMMALKFTDAYGNAYIADAVEAINYVTLMRKRGVNVRVANSSFTGVGTFPATLQDSIKAAGDAGVLFVAAAGNSNRNNDLVPTYPASYDLPNIISVASIDSAGRRSEFSNFGQSSVDLAAPGTNIFSTLPNGTYGAISGTSMAAPHVSGIAALAFSVAPNATVAQIKDAVLQGVDPAASLANITITGGRANARRTLDLLAPPTFSAPPIARMITRQAASLSAQAADSLGETGLTYSWALVGKPANAPSPVLSLNNTAAAKNTVATFFRAGYYTFTVTAKDPTGQTAKTSVSVNVAPIVTAVYITPGTGQIAAGQSRQFIASARDQFGTLLAYPAHVFKWSLAPASPGTLTSTGLFTAPAAAGLSIVRATLGSATGSATAIIV